MKKIEPNNYLLPNLFRLEYTKLTAVLCRRFGLKHIEIAEDIVSETFLKASETWEGKIPANPTAWLYTVAKNKTKDYLKHISVFNTQVKNAVNISDFQTYPEYDLTEQIITDSQLAMIFAVCNPSNSAKVQISMALKILCGFSVDEIAGAFLTKAETIKKRLHRGRVNLRINNFEMESLSKDVIESRLAVVLSTIYLLFNEGYFSKSDKHFIKKGLCVEAMRLALILTDNPLTNTSEVNALLALMCFQSSRLNARENKSGEAILYEHQDKDKWDKELIDRGNYYLVEACSQNEISKYHLEAAIAYWHTSADGDKWKHILHLYNQLLTIEYSPITALNRGFAFAKVHGHRKGIEEVLKLNLVGNGYFQSLLGYLWADIDINKAIKHYTLGIDLTKSKIEKTTLTKELAKLYQKKQE